jgi:hypothetical protein
MQEVEGVEQDVMMRVGAAVLESLECRPTGLIESHDLAVDDHLVGVKVLRRCSDPRVHGSEVLVITGLELHVGVVLDD